jgi:DNA polymerase III epsilon subunit-like protein
MHLPRFDRFVALDVEIARRSPLTVCAIAAVRYEAGEEKGHYHTTVAVQGRIRYTAIHGLTRADLHGAPAWGVVWQRVMGVLDGIETIVAYRAAFDRAAVMTMCARHAVRMPRVRFVCAEALYRSRFGRSVSLIAALRRLNLPFPGRPHDPLADARAAAALVFTLRALPEEGDAIQLLQNGIPAPLRSTADDPATTR